MAVVTYSSGSIRVQFDVNGTPQEIAGQTREQIEALEKELTPARTIISAEGPSPAISERHRQLLQWILAQDAIRSQNYISTHYPHADERTTRKLVTGLIKAGQLELKPATYSTAKGTKRNMTGVYPIGWGSPQGDSCEDQGHPAGPGEACACGEYGPAL